MFQRPEQNYEIEDAVIDGILNDAAQPLCRISKLLPEGATVLDIGAGSGVLGRVLKRAGKRMTIDGIEPNAFAADLARPFYRDINVGYAQEHFKAIQATVYDYVVLADVIEHIPDPAGFLAELLGNLPESTKLLISIPNIAFGGVRLSLLNGNFDYVDSGLLERTHLRSLPWQQQRDFSSLWIWHQSASCRLSGVSIASSLREKIQKPHHCRY